MANKPANKRVKKPEWYDTRPVFGAKTVGSIALAYLSAILAIDTASMFAYLAAAIFLVLTVHNAILTVRGTRR